MKRFSGRMETVAWLVALTLVLSAVAFLAQRFTHAQDTRTDHAMDSYNRYGTRGFCDLLRANGKDAQWFAPRLTSLGPTHRAIAILSPSASFTRAEVEHLLKWVSEGGFVLIAPSRQTSSLSLQLHAETIPPAQQLLGPLGLLIRNEGDIAGSARIRSDQPLLRGVQALYVPSHLRVMVASTENLKEAYKDKAGAPGYDFFLTPQVPAKNVATLGRLSGAAAIASVIHGKGRILVLAEADMIANYWIDRDDNVVLAANFAYLSGAKTLYFDKFHQGRSLLSIQGTEAMTSGWQRVIWLVIGGLLVFILGTATRFGAPVELRRKSRRSAREFVRAVAGLYMKAGARGPALANMARSLRAQAARCGRTAVTGATSADNEHLAHACAAMKPGFDERKLVRLLNAVDTAIGSKPDRSEFLHLSQAIAAMERELSDRGNN